MKFELLAVLSKMEELYGQPRSMQRFQEYLKLVQGTSADDMVLPIAGYNPMGEEGVLRKLRELKSINAEGIIQTELSNMEHGSEQDERTFRVAINLIDDIGGAWSNRHTTDYTHRFEMESLVKRNFCIVPFWTSEDYSSELVARRVREISLRTQHFLIHGKPKTLQEHVAQEIFVLDHGKSDPAEANNIGNEEVKKFYESNLNSTDYPLIFNFFYGDQASTSLGYKPYGIDAYEGFKFVRKLIAEKRSGKDQSH